jgi:DNA mismatch repair protein MutL
MNPASSEDTPPVPGYVGDAVATVRLLDDNTSNQIAAGEVVERPSSVVKELVENAMDAGATRIDVHIEDGGRGLIVVRDNGCGMSPVDAVLSVQRHATSKITTADDLLEITTFGFRGEALPSIASVSDFSLTTKRQSDEVGTQLVIQHGNVTFTGPAACPDGTEVRVASLFSTVPARLKFLKSNQTELNHVSDFLQRLVLSRPDVAVTLTHDGQTVLQFAGTGDVAASLGAVLGRDAVKDMVPLTCETPGLKVRGWVSKPSVTKATRAGQYFFVNNRAVRSRVLQVAFDRAFRKLVEGDRHPLTVIFIEIDPRYVDVNVHPAKSEVRFTRDGDIFAVIARAVEDALLTGGLIPEVNVTPSMPQPVIYARSSTPPRTTMSNFADVFAELPSRPLDGLFEQPAGSNDVVGMNSGGDVTSQGTGPNAYIGFDGYAISRLRVIGQSRNTYIVAETDDAILLIDQHVAHERVLYEQFMNGAAMEKDTWGIVAQNLVIPATLPVSPVEREAAVKYRDVLLRAGFDIDVFGTDTVVVRSVPATVIEKPYLGMISSILDDLAHTQGSRRLDLPNEAALIMASCRLAVKKGDPLTMDEMVKLLADLARMKNPFTCPHGRPILLALPHREMDRKFHRIGPH